MAVGYEHWERIISRVLYQIQNTSFFSLLFLQLELSKIKQVTSVKASRSGIVLVSLLVISVTQ